MPSNGDMKAKPLIDLLTGWPNPSLLPAALIRKASQSALSKPEVYTPAMLYGPDDGYKPLKESLAKWFSDFYKPRKAISPDRITITGGASQELACILQEYTDPVFTRNVWIVAPAYMLAFRTFGDNGLHNKMRAVPEDDEGIDIGYLERQISASEAKAKSDGSDQSPVKPARPWGKFYRHVIYAVPTFSNPSGQTMSLPRREAVVRLARRFDALVINDDVYDFLQWPADPATPGHRALATASVPRIVDVDRFLDGGAEREGADGFGNVASNGSFSKICAPGARTGWVEGTPKLAWGVSQVGSSRSGGAPSHLTSTYLNELVESGELQQHIYHSLQPAYASRYRTMRAAIDRHLAPLGVRLASPDVAGVAGGYFLWLTLPPTVTAADVTARAKEEQNLIVAPGALFEVPGDASADDRVNFAQGVRLCFAWADEEKLGEGVERLARVLQTMLEAEGAESGMQH